MLSKLRILRFTYTNGSPYFFNPLCTMVESHKAPESPQLPTWLNFSDNPLPQIPNSNDDDDDFVIPALADWVDSHTIHDRTQVKRLALRENEGENDVAATISRVLKERYASPEEVAEALDGCGFLVSHSLVEKILKRFGNDWVSALGFFSWAKSQTGYVHSPELYELMVDILGKLKKFHLMWDLIEEMDRIEGYVTFTTMVKVMRRLTKAGKYEEAVEVFRNMDRFGVKKDTMGMNVLMDALVKGDSVEHAHKVHLEFKDSIPLNNFSFNVLIHGWCKVRKLEQAYEAMEDMKKHGFHPDVVTYTSFIEAHCREKDFRKVDELFEKMKEEGCSPSVVTYTILMHALGKAGELSEALKVYERMKSNGCIPDTQFYSSLIFILGQAGKHKDALEVFEDMPKQGVVQDVMTYTTMISIACAHSQEETALRLLKEMEEKQCHPEIDTYHPLLKMCCKKKRMKVLNFLLDHMFRNNLSLEVGTYSLLVNGMCKSGKLERACLFFEDMVSQGLTPQNSIFKTLVRNLESKRFQSCLDRVVEDVTRNLRLEEQF
ncbi:pentatricopeptide repeat-containing protein [Senna tora]|uniref:Pentatricopeptide repeat-containing protein n=1 Tax=Senna tora TaxID=362788 RepID=A0A834T0P9_9FABA|nr:pentatricopeptide repeat-containing protein [Senna tora]